MYHFVKSERGEQVSKWGSKGYPEEGTGLFAKGR